MPLIDLSSHAIQTPSSQVLGQGSFSKVYAGTLDGEPVAVKELPLGCDASVLSPFQHPNIVAIKGFAVLKNPLILMERMASTLQDQLKFASQGTLSSRILWLKQVAHALAYLHQLPDPVVHGDLKTSSILIDNDGNAKINNIGLYQLKKESRSYRTPDCHLPFIAPEVYSEVDCGHTPAQDVFAFGMIMYETLCGHPPFSNTRSVAISSLVENGQRPQQPTADVIPLWLWFIINRCWSHSSIERPSMGEVELLLASEGGGVPSLAATARPVQQQPPTYEQVNVTDLELALNTSFMEAQSSSRPLSEFIVPPPIPIPPTYQEISRTDVDILWDFLPEELKRRRKIHSKQQLRNLQLQSLRFGSGHIGSNLMFTWKTDDDRLIGLNLKGEGIIGVIPPEFGELTELEELDLSENRLVGTIPPELGNLSKLVSLDLSKNKLEGRIPPSLAYCTRLVNL
ncbi:hypothetical protein HDU79_010858 [Rhizoclosmatium sp. JEL0117]|nr:hypothetical protein HDU79_010858 [Rhizoclosmatium sp. JEL0117]